MFVPTIRTNIMTCETKNKTQTYDTRVVKRLQEKYGVSKRYITMSLSGDRESETSEAIKKDYAKMNHAVSELLKTL